MLRALHAKIGSLRLARAPSEDAPDSGTRDESAGTSRRTLITRGLYLVAGAVGVGVASSAAQSSTRTIPVAVPATPLATVGGVSNSAFSLVVRDVRFSSPATKPGELPAGKVFKA